ncbi:ABC transporter substrate-binding protein [Bradyrhizobium sp. AUGA SZCCT0240]|uniref:ABC transporter substrate-binding protein n=1 Tax=unclassified Bradyrhizobium TaxID=2631580 RepID=UPI001BAC158E|nr:MULTISPECIES: ABC transporter substrate-binding protein [unclassified Bradyrhizobium]MBR1195586.1 ABC transporter substrate-binding protein [Bradyrhizobium sp. AUGA SZCCT0158]MBR1242552.1 ABC transporter substrate-binding protein [Bradyrhizobium sp. AUGA SZCCT0274]MBR1252358.1 ABC transporter substrate-binding protein [Bradyrhizobium sp. AUGA SZCCT0240]
MRATPFNAFLAASAVLLATSIPASAENGVSADKIVFGQAAALDGPASALGQGMKIGLEAAFAEINKAGGVKGRKLELKSVDDGYEPTRSIEAAKKLLEEDKVFALVGAVGTPTSAATQPIATAAGAPFIGAFTGAEFLREPHKPLVMNIRASYFQETEAMVERVTKDLGATKIAIMYQDDAFGQAGLAGVKKALEKRQMQLAGEGTFERNTVAVKAALLAIKKVEPQAVIMISPYKPAAEFIKLAKQIKLDATFVNISFVGSDALAKELGAAGTGVVITQVVPFPKDAAIPVVGRYHASLKASAPDAQPGFVSLEGYLVGRAIAAALEKVDGDLTRQAMIDAVQKAGSLDLGGFKLSYSPTSNRGSNEVFLTVIQADGSFKAVDRLEKSGS